MTRRALDLWERWWFPADAGIALAACRILVVAAQLFVFMPFFSTTLEGHLALVGRDGGFDRPQWMIALTAAVIPFESGVWPYLLRVVYAMTVVGGVATLVGWRTRASSAVFALGTWFLVSHESSYGEAHHAAILIALFLLFLALSPSGRRLSLDARRRSPTGPTDMAVWPLRLTQVLLAWTYFSNAVAKLAYGGIDWMNGYTLQYEFLQAGLEWDRPLGVWLSQFHSLGVALSVGTIAFELAFPLVLVARRSRPWLLAGGTVFHLLTWRAMNVAFLQHVVLYAAFIDSGRWRATGRTILERGAR